MSTAPSRPQRWHLVYFVLGAFNVLSVAAGLYLSQSVLDIYEGSVADNQRWATRMGEMAQLGQLATAANAPGNDVFESGDIDGESRRLDAAVEAFDAAVARTRLDLAQASPEHRLALMPHLDAAATAVGAMTDDARAIFAAKRAGDDARAGARMASMDRNLSVTSDALGRLGAQVQQIQETQFAAQIAAAGQVGTYQYVLLAVVVLMVVGMVAYGLQLARVFAAQQAEVDRRNADLRRVLDNVGQGFFTVDRAGLMSIERSAVLGRWFGASSERETLWSFFGRASPHVGACMEVGWASLLDDVLPLELALDQLPRELAVGGRHYGIDYRPVADGASFSQMLIVVSDITDQVTRALAEEEQKETVAVFERIVGDRAGFVEFFDEADALVRTLAHRQLDGASDRRLLHTLKGNTSLFGLTSIARRCHALETSIEDGRTLDASERSELHHHWQRIALRLKTMLGERLSQRLELDQPEYDAVLGAVIEGAPRWQIAERLRSWTKEPAERRLARIAENARAIARRLNKPDLRVDIDHHQMRLPTDGWAPFWAALTHVIRNAIDHGIESGDEREASGKAPRGRLGLATYTEHDRLVVEVTDDGRGIDWATLRDKAARRGVSSDGDLASLLFVDGLSSRSEITELSGRGVGMSAVRDAARALGGEIDVSSVPGTGTTVRFVFPDDLRVAASRAVVVRPSITPQA